MKKTLLIATANRYKLKEIKQILQKLPFEIKSLKEINFSQKISESGNTFRENALIKAETVGQKTGLLTLAEDSGLEIDCLNGLPGVRSARYLMGSDLDRVNQVLKELQRVPTENRGAKFVSVVALYNPATKSVKTWRGESSGRITQMREGSGGFGYDPIFYNFDLKKTNAQATGVEKNRVSHRARALKKAADYIISSIQ